MNPVWFSRTKPSHHPSFDRLVVIARDIGVKIEFLEENPHATIFEGDERKYHSAPTVNAHIHWKTRTIQWWDEDRSEHAATALAHEMSHVLVDVDPDHVAEVESSMLAIERRLHAMAGVPWRAVFRWFEDYGIGHCDWWEATPSDRAKVMRESEARLFQLQPELHAKLDAGLVAR